MSEALVRNLETMEYKILKINYPRLYIPYTKCWRVKTQGIDQRKERRKMSQWRGEEEKRRRMEEGKRKRGRREQSGREEEEGWSRGEEEWGRVFLPVLLPGFLTIVA